MAGDMLLAADNMLNRAGILYVRPGLVGQLGGTPPSSSSASPSSSSSSAYVDLGATSWDIYGNAVYGLCLLQDSSGNTWIIETSGGKLYKHQQGTGYRTELKDYLGASYNIDSANAQAAVFQDFAYVVDGAHRLIRLDLDGGFPAYPMQAPTQAPVVGLTNTLLFQANSASNWSFDGQATADTNILAQFGDINAAGNTWGSVNIGGASTPGPWVNLISPNAALYAAGSGPTPQPGMKIPVPALSGNSNLYPSRFHLLMPCIKDTFAGAASVNVYVTPYNSAQQQIAGAFVTNIVPVTGSVAGTADVIIDMSSVGPNVAYLTFEVVNALAIHGGNMFIGTPQLYPITVQTTFNGGPVYTTAVPTISGGAIQLSSSSSSSSSSSGNSSSSLAGVTPNKATDLGTLLDYQGTSFIFTFPITSSSSSSSSSGWSSSSGGLTGGIDLSLVDRLVIGVGGGQIASWSGASFQLSLLQGSAGNPGQTWILADNGVTISDDLTGLDCDISTLTTAQRTNITALKLTFQTNVQWLAPYYGLPLGPITTPGNLSIGLANYSHYVTEQAVIDTANVIEGNPSLASLPVTPTFAQAEEYITIPSDCPVNTSAPANVPSAQLWYNLYRIGGSWSDARLIASVSSNSDVPYGTDPANPYYSWNHVTKQFLDNTPDIWLQNANLMSFSKDPMPANAQAIAVFQGRLTEAVGNVVYISWLYNTDNSAPLMTTLTINLSDPNYPVAGANFPVSEDASDTIVAMVPYGTPVLAGNEFGSGLAVFCKRSVWLIQGENAEDFSVRQYPYTAGVGLVAARGVARLSPNEMIFMGPDRLHIFPPEGDSPTHDIGLRIQPQLYPVTPQVLQNQTAFSKSWMCFHDARLYLGCPQPGTNQNTVVWVYDTRTGGWTRKTGPETSNSSSSSLGISSSSSSGLPDFPQYGMPMTSALSLPPNASGADFDLYYFGLDGQVYLATGTYDQFSPAVPAQNIPFYINFHGLRPGFYVRYKQRPLYYMWARLERAEIEMMMNGTLTITAQAFNAGLLNPTPIPGRSFVFQYKLAGGGRPFDFSLPPGLIEGQFIEMSLSGSVGLDGNIAYCRGVRGFISGSTYERG